MGFGVRFKGWVSWLDWRSISWSGFVVRFSGPILELGLGIGFRGLGFGGQDSGLGFRVRFQVRVFSQTQARVPKPLPTCAQAPK